VKGGWLTRYLIVPEAHVRIGDFHFQAELYDVFHRRWGSRLGHLLCTPVVVTGAFLALSAIPLTLPGGLPVGALLLAVGMVAFFFFLDRFVGLLATPVVAGLFAASIALARLLDGRAFAAGALAMAAGAVAQAVSHLFEEVPPPWSGHRSWRPLGEVLRAATARTVLGLAGLTLMSFLLEWWASFRILGLQLNFLAMQTGLRPALTKRLERRRAAILADHRAGWPGAAVEHDNR
jgi:hypothetical protein